MGFELTPRERRLLDAILILGTLALAYVVLLFLTDVFRLFGDLIMVFFLAWLIAFMLGPAINWVTRIPFMSRIGAIVIVYVVLFGGLVVVSIVVASALVNSIGDFIVNLPGLRADLPNLLAPWQERLDQLALIQIDLITQVGTFLDNLGSYALALVDPLQSVAVASLGALGNLLLVIVLSLYIVADRERLVAFGFWLVPASYRAEAEVLEEAVGRSFGGFIRGQVLTGVAYAGVAFLVSVIFGLDYLPVTTAASGFLMAIPFFGPFVSWLPPVLIAFLAKPDVVLWVTIAMVVGWVLVMQFVSPRLLANALRIHPIVVLGSVLVGIKLAGIPGAIFGIPIAAVVSAFFLHTVNRNRTGAVVAARAAARVARREGRAVRAPREPDPSIDRDVEPESSSPDA